MINISWMMGGKFPGMPFNGQMTLPTALALKSYANGVRLAKAPVREFELTGATRFGFRLKDTEVAYDVEAKTLTALGMSAPLSPGSNRVKIRAVLDRASIEAFGNVGEVSLSSNFLPVAGRNDLELFTTGGTVKVISLEAHKLRGSWVPADSQAAWEKSRQSTGVADRRKAVRIRPDGMRLPSVREYRNLLGRLIKRL